MKPQYIFFLLFALFITGLSDGLSLALFAIPGIGIILDFVIEMSINCTMGAGLLMLLILNGMYHPKLSPFGIVGGFLPGLNVLPFWAGLVIVGIVHKTSEERGSVGVIGTAAKVAVAAETGGATSALQTARTINHDITSRPANDNLTYAQTAA